ncbi:tryptophan 2,3-dioxygenase family protein [Hymenobacter humi]
MRKVGLSPFPGTRSPSYFNDICPGPTQAFPTHFTPLFFMTTHPTQEEFSPAVLAQLRRLQEKYAPDGQDLAAYLEGLYHAKYINYWDYIELDTLLSLQRPLTNLPDERIFIMYHQISELYFKLCLCEYEQIGDLAEPTLGEVVLRLGRINRYFENLIDSFDVMVDGMDKQQFLDFRMALMPASGFQSVQYRKIEIASTSLENLTDKAKRQALGEASAHDYDQMLGCIYWKAGATIEASGAKALTLIEFERKYTADLVRHAEAYHDRNVWAVVQRLPEEDRTHPRLLRALRQLDISVNVNWPLMHFKSAVRYLQRNPTDVAATGGTNWRNYLPPKFQRRIFYPQLWTEQELTDWGKSWVEQVLEEGVKA